MITTASKSVTLTAAQKKEKINNHREYHRQVLEHYRVPDADFNVKLVFYDKGQKVVGIFPNEFTKKNGFYIEFVDKALDPTDPERKLYRLPPIENFENVFGMLSSGSYAVPLENLEEVKPVTFKKITQEINLEGIQEGSVKQDDHINKMTIRDFAAIIWQRPVSEKPWLNDMIDQLT
jgi:hypothetical protein